MPNTKKASRWTSEEDVELINAVNLSLELDGQLESFERTFELPKNFRWVQVSERMSNRNSKQCRERFHNHAKPGINPLPWSETEDMVLMLLIEKYPCQWTVISKYLKGRTENMVKLRWRYHQRRNRKLAKKEERL